MVQVLVNGVWQGAIIVALAFGTTRLLVRESAATRYGVWLTALLALAIVPALSVLSPLHLPSFASTFAAAQPARIRMTLVAASTIADSATSFVLPALILWFAASAFACMRLAISALSIARIRRAARPLSGYDDVVVSDTISAPIAAGLRVPVVILPTAILERLPAHDISLIIAHERAHIARHDISVNLVQRMLEALLVFNPWIYVIGYHLVKEREAACDDAAVVQAHAIDEYTSCLAAVARAIVNPRAPLVSPSVFGSRQMLFRRIERLVNNGESLKPGVNWYAMSAAILSFVLVAMLLQSVAPAFAAPAGATAASPRIVATACAHPDADAQVAYAAPPDFPDNAHPKRPVLLRVTVAADGSVPHIDIIQSSGDWSANQAAMDSATHSRFTPAMRNCRAVRGTYVFRVEFMP